MSIDDEIRELIASARENYKLAYEYEQKCSERRETIRIRELKRVTEYAAAGNEADKAVMKQLRAEGKSTSFDVSVDTIASNDTLWRGYVANNQFYTRKADLDNQMAQTLLKAKELGVL